MAEIPPPAVEGSIWLKSPAPAAGAGDFVETPRSGRSDLSGRPSPAVRPGQNDLVGFICWSSE